MSIKTLSATAFALTLATTAQADKFSGSIGHFQNFFEGGGQSNKYTGSIEYTLNQNFGVAGDLSLYEANTINDKPNGLTLHGIYHMSDRASFGAFIGRSKLGSATSEHYGFEAGTELQGATIEGTFYRERSNATNATVNVIDLDGEYNFANNFSVLTDISYAETSSNSSTKIFSIGSSYTINNGPKIHAKIGRISARDTPNNTSARGSYIGIGTEIALGSQRGTTFSPRNVINSAFGF